MSVRCVHVVDDDDDLRQALAGLLIALGFEVSTHRSAGEFLFAASLRPPDCVLLDIEMPGQSGLELQQALNGRGLQIPIVFLTGKGTIAQCAQALKSGAVDFLTKPFTRETLQAALEVAFERAEQTHRQDAQANDLRDRFDALTDRERMVADQIVEGRLNKQIAFEFGVSERTIKTYRSQVMEKMQVHSVPQLVQAIIALRAHGGGPGH